MLINSNSQDLADPSGPHEVSKVLRNAADAMRTSHADLASAWQDKHAGVVWNDLAKILDNAAVACDKACKRYGF